MASPAESAASLLVTAGVVVTTPTAGSYLVRVGLLTEDQDALVAIFDSGGQNASPKFLLDFPRIACCVRGNARAYSDAYNKVRAVKDVLLGLEPQTLSGDRWCGVTGVGDIMFLKYDEKDRPLFTVNFRIILEPGTNALTHRESL